MFRVLEFSLALLGLIILAPLILILAFLIAIKMGRPVIFKQQRPGLNAKPFMFYKFRTMAVGDTADAQRLTKLGMFLRKYSLDELPQLYNVLKGDIGLVGPRPLLMEYLPLYSAEQARRHLVRPGITGWAQINGRNAISWEQKFKLDVWYVDHKSWLLDLKILILTVWKVIAGRDIAHGTEATMHKFTGTGVTQ